MTELMSKVAAFKLANELNQQLRKATFDMQATVRPMYVAIPHKRYGWFGWYWEGWSVEEWRFDGRKWVTERTVPINASQSPLEGRRQASGGVCVVYTDRKERLCTGFKIDEYLPGEFRGHLT